MKKKMVNILGEEVEEEKLKNILKDVLKMRGISGEIKLELKEGVSKKQPVLYKYAFFDCLG